MSVSDARMHMGSMDFLFDLLFFGRRDTVTLYIGAYLVYGYGA